jgi:antitoxin component YwqK of YwqJK toxin-antitoxin module
MRVTLFFVLFFGLVACTHPPFSVNYRDKNDKLQGKWRVTYPGKKQLYYKVRYKNSMPVGKMKYFYPDGSLYRLENYRDPAHVKTTFYYPNGKVELTGEASLTQHGDTSTYQWNGPWQKYDTLGNHVEEQTYLRGNLIWVRKIKPD